MKENIHITRNNISAGDVTPVGNITPKFIGQQYIMTSEDKVFFAKGLTSEDWIEASSSGIKDEPNTKHETINGIKEFESTKGYIDNVSIEGKTLVNIVDKLYRINGADADGIVRTRFSILGDNFNHNKRLSTGTWTFYNMTDKAISFVGTDTSDNWVNNTVGDVQAYSYKTVTLDGTYCIAGADFRPANGWSNSDLSIYDETMIMVIEGAHKELPYFKGICSLGQDSHIDLLTLGEKVDLSNLTWEDGRFVNGPDGSVNEVQVWSYAQDYIPVEDTGEYLIFANKNMCFYDKDKNIIPTSWIDEATTIPMDDYYNKYNDRAGHVIVRPPKGCCFIRINQLTEVKNLTKMYKRYDKKQVSTILRALPNGVRDTIEKKGDKYLKVQRCGELVLKDNFSAAGTGVSNQVLTRGQNYDLPGLKRDINSPIICDYFKSEHRDNEVLDEEHIINLGDGRFRIRVEKTKLIEDSAVGSFEYLNSINPTIVYELETPIITELLNFNTKTYEGNTTLFLSTGIVQGECDFEVTNSLSSEMDVIKNKINNLEDIAEKIHGVEKISCKTLNGECEIECKDGYTDNMLMEGNVLINYIYKVEKLNLTEASGNISTTNGTFTESNGVYSYTTSGGWADMGQIVPVKPNTTYTFSVNYLELNGVKSSMCVMLFSSHPQINASGANESIRIGISKKSSITTHGRHFHTFTTPENCTHVLCVTSFETTDLTYKATEFMLTEGKEHYPYFKGMISAGENNINVITYDSNRSLYPREYDNNLLMNQYIESNPANANFGTTVASQWMCLSNNFIEVKPNSLYIIPYANGNITQYDSNGTLLSFAVGTKYLSGGFMIHKPVVILRTSSNTKYVKVAFEKQYIGMVEMYEVEKCDNKIIPTTLRTLLDKKETIFKLNNSYYKRVLTGIHQCTGADPIVNNIEVHGDYTRFAIETQTSWGIVKAERRNSWCDKFPIGSIFDASVLQEGHYTSGGGRIYFKVATSRLASSDATGVKAFLDQEKPIVIYELATPRLEKVPSLDCLTFGNKTTLLISSGAAQVEATFETTSMSDGLESKIDDIDNSISNFNNSINTINTSITNMNSRIKNITYSTSEPTASQGQNGDLWIIYEA